jgi:hypothetical protein
MRGKGRIGLICVEVQGWDANGQKRLYRKGASPAISTVASTAGGLLLLGLVRGVLTLFYGALEVLNAFAQALAKLSNL